MGLTSLLVLACVAAGQQPKLHRDPMGWALAIDDSWVVIDRSRADKLAGPAPAGAAGGKLRAHERQVLSRAEAEVRDGLLVLLLPSDVESAEAGVLIAIRTVEGRCPPPSILEGASWEKSIREQLGPALAPSGTGIEAKFEPVERIRIGGVLGTMHVVRLRYPARPEHVSMFWFVPGGDRLFRIEATAPADRAKDLERRTTALLKGFQGAAPGAEPGFFDTFLGRALRTGLIGAAIGLGLALVIRARKARSFSLKSRRFEARYPR